MFTGLLWVQGISLWRPSQAQVLLLGGLKRSAKHTLNGPRTRSYVYIDLKRTWKEVEGEVLQQALPELSLVSHTKVVAAFVLGHSVSELAVESYTHAYDGDIDAIRCIALDLLPQLCRAHVIHVCQEEDTLRAGLRVVGCLIKYTAAYIHPCRECCATTRLQLAYSPKAFLFVQVGHLRQWLQHCALLIECGDCNAVVWPKALM
mmetsp:Transcript_111308/g.208728  ORF Transcript_111308/g.208728 Transcript_111308/m.208728 type:complete len:204 (+) Transcript_111308:891-1502(+)